MKNIIVVFLLIGVAMSSCMKANENPFYQEFQTKFQVPPYDLIKNEHFLPAFEKGIAEAAADIKKIVDNTEAPNFKNTIEALEFSGEILGRVTPVFFALLSANTSDELQQLAQKISPMLSKHSDDIMLNEALFNRVKSVYDNRNEEKLDQEQLRLVEKYYKDFTRNGALLGDAEKEILRNINQELSTATLQFSNNMLAETNKYKLFISNSEDISGLPESLLAGAKEAAEREGRPDEYLFTLHNPSVMPFLHYADNRELRRQISEAYLNRANNNCEHDNKELIRKIVRLRQEKARLLGYPNHAEYVLEQNMAKNTETVFKFLNELWAAALPNAQREMDELQQMIHRDGESFQIEAWDWRYYTEKLRKERYDLDEETVSAYLSLDNVLNGAFYVAEQLFGIKFKKLSGLPTYHEEVTYYEVTEADGTHIGLLYTDFYTRPSKRGGAWMNSIRQRAVKDGKTYSPIVGNTCNFTRPTAGKPSLLTFDEAETLFHEFGHALHGLFASNKYPSIGGTSVPRDFVELPSQVMEHWFSQPEVMRVFAKHYETGEVIPDEILEKLEASDKFNQGFATAEFLASALLDMHYYTHEDFANIDAASFEQSVTEKIGLMRQIPYRHRSTYFAHIFSGGYSAGYYSYIWSGVLDADAFEAFVETSLFDKNTATSFRKNILERGNTDDPMNLYKKFRGREPSIEPLLRKRGLM